LFTILENFLGRLEYLDMDNTFDDFDGAIDDINVEINLNWYN